MRGFLDSELLFNGIDGGPVWRTGQLFKGFLPRKAPLPHQLGLLKGIGVVSVELLVTNNGQRVQEAVCGIGIHP